MGDRVLQALATQLGERLLATGQRLMTVESCTGGWVAQVLTSVPGSSQWFERGLVTYSNRAKSDLAGVDPKLIQQFGAVSEEVAAAMARGGLARSRANLSLAITGIAGPGGGSPEKPVGTVWFAWAGFPGTDDNVDHNVNDNEPERSHRRFTGDREAVRRQSVQYALEGALERLASAG